jgi:cytochrome c-type biogenesis protein CcmH/NrfG
VKGSIASWLMLGRVLARRGDPVGARKAFQAAVENLSNTVDADHPKLLLARQLAEDGTMAMHIGHRSDH